MSSSETSTGTSPETSTELARRVVLALLEAGVTDVVVAPGSRNQPLSFAVYDAAQAGLLRLHTRIDERSAGFLALGLTKGGRRAAVMCTSGTAVANLHPAVLEAAHAGLALVVVTADRPARLRGTGANQTTDQVDVFGRLVATRDLGPGSAIGDLLVDRPVHLNAQLDEPLTPPDRWRPIAPALLSAPEPSSEVAETLQQGPRTVVVAGDDAGPLARRIAEDGGWPLLAEPSSGSRTGAALRTYRLLLGSPLADRVERVVLAGHPTLSRPVSRLLGRADVEVVALPARGVWPTHPFPVARTLAARPTVIGEPDAAWLAEWQAADRSLARQLDRLVAGWSPYVVAGAVARAVAPGDTLVIGPSSPIRDLDVMMAPYPVGERRKVLANRGLAGIDGVVSTAIGAALARPHGRTLALLGDVTFLHDAGGLVLGPQEPRPDLTIVVVNDDGGSIFATLEQGAEEYADGFERLFGTPHGADLAPLCAASRTPHLRVTSLGELEQALASPNGGIEVVEAVVSRADRRATDAAIRALRPA